MPVVQKDLRITVKTSRQQIREGAGISHEDFWKGMEEKEPAKRRSKKRQSKPV